MTSLESMFEPRSIAILGASESSARFGGRVLHNLVSGGYRGHIYPVNPKYTEIRGLKCFHSLSDIPHDVDMAIFALPASQVLTAIEDCGAKEIPLAVVFTSGFAELGGKGVALQSELVATARRCGVRLLGPNGLGFLNVQSRIAATATGILPLDSLLPGELSLVSQSGALAFPAIFSRAHDHGVGFRFVVATGNEADLTSADIIKYYVRDRGTKVIAAMIEGISDPVGFVRAMVEAREAGKPVVVLKVGRTAEGRRAAASHTAAMAGSDAVNDAVFERYGVIRVDDLDELWEVGATLLSTRLPKGRRVAMISSSGGLGGLFADHLRMRGLELADLSVATQDGLRELLPSYAVISNPIDITGAFAGTEDEPAAFQRCISLLNADPGIDIVVVAQVVVSEGVGRAVTQAALAAPKTTAVLAVGGSRAAAGLHPFIRSGVHIFDRPLSCANALAHLCKFAESLPLSEMRELRGVITSPSKFGDGVVDEGAVAKALTDYGLPLADYSIVSTAEEASAVADRIGYPVAVKALVADVVHKTELGAVALAISDSSELRAQVERLLLRFPGAPILIQQMVEPGVEMILGINRDDQFGPIVLIGAGGIFTEVYDDHQVAIPPLSPAEAERLIRRLKVHKVLLGHRARPPADVRALVELLVRVSEIAVDNAGTIESLDLNPVIVLPEGSGCRVVDWALIGRNVSSARDRDVATTDNESSPPSARLGGSR